ncbi:multisubstrate pseudouridine synthase 7 [Cannabis sativa]|nr:multisubstrate pseudouridine synthase 7 [Cannabis sativa]
MWQKAISAASWGCLSLPVLKPYFLCNTTIVRASPKPQITMKNLDESDVGVFCYISNLPGFRGVLKQRYSDFIVNEVDTDGNVVHLTTMEAPPEEIAEEIRTETEANDAASKNYTSEFESFRSLAGDSDAESFEAFMGQINSSDGKESVSPIVLSPDSDKLHRTAMHNFFKKNFKFLVTDTIDGPDVSSKCIRVRLDSGGHGKNSRKRKDRGGKPFDSRGSDDWQENIGKFLRFHICKENKDSQEALGVIAKMLGIQPRSFGFAGTKDKRAVSTQRVTVFKQRAKKLAALNDRLIGIKVGDFCYVKEGLVLGQLWGNRFTVTLRGVVADCEETIRAAASALGRQGFINYFGLQRFGSGSVPTYLIGSKLLRGEWEAAVNMILDPREGERNTIAMARQYYKETNDIDGTLRQLPRYLVAERAVLQCLKKCPGNHLQALKAIPRTLRMMYVHSYQSYLWNHAASTRVQKHGTDHVVVGDLVYCKEHDIEKAKEIGNAECEEEDPNDTLEAHELDEISDTVLPEEKKNPVKAVTAEDILNGNYTIDDVVLPLPGSRVIFPTNDIAQVYHDLAMKDTISLTESVHNVKEFSITSMTGSYRRVFQKPVDYEWELLKYTDGNIPLAETDLDVVAKSKRSKPVEELGVNESKGINEFDCSERLNPSENDIKLQADDKEVGGKREVGMLIEPKFQDAQTALKLSFTLPASCYATMAIRELLKTSTSVAFHKTLN